MAPARPLRRSWWAPRQSNTSSGALQTTVVWKSTTAGRLEGCSSERSGSPPWVSVWRSRASSMGRMELSRVEMRAELRLHIAPNTLRSSSRRDTRCSCSGRDNERKAGNWSDSLWPLTLGQHMFHLRWAGNFYCDYRSEVCANKIVDLFCIA